MATDLENFRQPTPGGPWYRTNGATKGAPWRLAKCPRCGIDCMLTKDTAYCSISCGKLAASENAPATYHAVHKRLRRYRGPASAQPCSFGGDCTGRMMWCFNEAGDPQNLDDYFPACSLHHKRFDTAVAMMSKEVARKWGEGAWQPWSREQPGFSHILPGRERRTPKPVRGEANHFAKLTADQVAAIRGSSLTAKAIALKYGISASHARRLRRGDSWPDVPTPDPTSRLNAGGGWDIARITEES